MIHTKAKFFPCCHVTNRQNGLAARILAILPKSVEPQELCEKSRQNGERPKMSLRRTSTDDRASQCSMEEHSERVSASGTLRSQRPSEALMLDPRV